MNLITRLEAATGPDPALDAAIVAEIHDAIVKPYPPTDDFGPRNRWQFWTRDGSHFLANEGRWPVPPLTKSIDAALTLLPEGWHWRLDQGRNAGASLYRDGFPQHFSVADTPAIALCIVALKARPITTGERDNG